MSVYVASLILLAISSAYAILLKRKLAETVFLAVVTVTAILFSFGLLNFQGCLLYGIYFIISLAIACVIYFIYMMLRKKTSFREIELQQGLIIYAVFLAFALFINYGRTFHIWDEFSHWGFIVKHFFIVDALGTVKHINYNVRISSYLPGTSLFLYFFTRFSDRFIEYCSYIGMNIMYFCIFMPFIKDLFSKRHWKKQIFLLATFLLLPLVVMSTRFYRELYVDTMLGIFFGFTLLYYFVYKYEKTVYGLLMVSAAILMLTATKDTGIIFSMIIIGIICIDKIFFGRVQMFEFIKGPSRIDLQLKKLLMLSLPLICILYIKAAWSNLLIRNNLTTYFRVPSLISIINSFVFGQLEQYQIVSLKNFLLALFYKRIPLHNMSVVEFSAFFILVAVIITWLNKDNYNYRRMLLSTILLVIGLLGYLFSLAIVYAFIFIEFEAIQLASYERYISSYLIAMLLFILTFYLVGQNEQMKENNMNPKKITMSKGQFVIKNELRYGDSAVRILIGVILLFLVINISKYGFIDTVLSRIYQDDSFKPRPTAIAVEKWKSYFENEDPYIIIQGENGFSYFRMLYDLIPFAKLANIREDYSISTEPYYSGSNFPSDPWTFIVTPGEWEQYVLDNYTLVYVYKSDDVLETTYGQFFPFGVQSDMCYYVQKESESLKLIPVTG